METQPKSKIETFKNLVFTASFIISTGILLVSFYNTRETDRINHRLNIREAYFNKGLIDGEYLCVDCVRKLLNDKSFQAKKESEQSAPFA